MKALIVVDLQNDFIPGGSLAVPGGYEIIPIINRLEEKFPLVSDSGLASTPSFEFCFQPSREKSV